VSRKHHYPDDPAGQRSAVVGLAAAIVALGAFTHPPASLRPWPSVSTNAGAPTSGTAAAVDPIAPDEDAQWNQLIGQLTILWRSGDPRNGEPNPVRRRQNIERVLAIIQLLPRSAYLQAMSAMMDENAPADLGRNALVPTLFGDDALDSGLVRRLIEQSQRGEPQRLALLAYFEQLPQTSRPRLISGAHFALLADGLADRLLELSDPQQGHAIDDREDALVSALFASALQRDPEQPLLWSAMERYAGKSTGDTPLAWTIQGWLDIKAGCLNSPQWQNRLAGLGHWDGAVRLQTAQLLGRWADDDEELRAALVRRLEDWRGPVRAGAALALSASHELPTAAAALLHHNLSVDADAAARSASASAIAAHLSSFDRDLLWDALQRRTWLAGADRDPTLWPLWQALIDQATDDELGFLRTEALARLDDQPAAALTLIRLMGRHALPLRGELLAYRATAPAPVRGLLRDVLSELPDAVASRF
jgi:hypothetical protein